ncbi:MAG TPA: hypothetical protein VNA24_27730 [Hyalangium sp.]|nr:hypothetical protein [Hyalangium sp.]
MALHGTCRLVLALILLIGLTGCREDPEENGCIDPFEPFEDLANPGIVRAGGPARVYALPLSFHVCANEGSNYPTSATAEVTGPAGETIEAQIELGTQIKVTAVQFTPAQPGLHHVLIEFAPRGGLHQVNVYAAQDRTAETTSQSLSQLCTSLERTLQGAWVCDSTVLRGTETLGSFASARLVVAGDVIWVVDSTSVSRYVDTGTALTLTGTTPRSATGIEFLLAAPNELAVLLADSLILYTFQDGALTSGGATPWLRPGSPIMLESPHGVLLREGDQLAVATRTSPSNTTPFQVCPYQLIAGRFERTPGTCPQFRGEIIGFEPGILWTRDLPEPNPMQLRRWVWAGGQLTEQGSLPLGTHVTVPDRPKMRSGVVPLVRNTLPAGTIPPNSPSIPLNSSVVTWSPQRQALLLETLDEENTNNFASPGLYWEVTSPSDPQPTKVRLRPPTP